MNIASPWLFQPLGWINHRSETTDESRPAQPDSNVFSDEQLVKIIIRKSSQPHFRMLIARYQAKVQSIALSVLGPGKHADAEDVAQDVFVKVYQQLGKFRGDTRFSTWLYRVAMNMAIDHQRKHARHQGEELSGINEPVSLQTAEHDQLEHDQLAV